MTDHLHNNTKDNCTNSINNYSSDLSKNPVPISNINTNMNSNSFSQENFFNELINSTNYQESKNNSSFYNFSESVHSNPDNPNIIMNKDQLYQTFLLFQKFLSQNINNNNIKTNTPQRENDIPTKYKSYNKNTIKDNNNVIDEINEMNEFDYNEDDNENENENENEQPSNGKIMFRKNRTSQNWKKHNINIDDEKNNHKELIESKSHYNIINGKETLKNGGYKNNNNKKIIFFDENDNDRISNFNNKNIQKRNNSDDIKKNPLRNSYDDIPIKFNKINFIDLVEKKLADEKKK